MRRIRRYAMFAALLCLVCAPRIIAAQDEASAPAEAVPNAQPAPEPFAAPEAQREPPAPVGPVLAQEPQPGIDIAPSGFAQAALNENGTISLDIKGMDVVDVLKMLSMRSGINLVVGKNVSGRVTLFIKNVNVRDAFDIVVLANDLAYDSKGGIINVMTQRDYELMYGERFQDTKKAKVVKLKYARAAELAKSLNQIKSVVGKIVVDEGSNTLALIDSPDKIDEMDRFIEAADAEIATRVFSLNYAKAEQLNAKLQDAVTKGVGVLKIDERTNKIVATDYPAKLDELARIIAEFDEKMPQVLIDAQIIEVRPSDKFEMGVDWDYWIENHFKISSALPLGTSGRLLVGTPPSDTVTGKGDYRGIVDLLRTIGDAKILSTPRIMALNNQEARILVGTKDAYITSSTSQSTGTAVTSQAVNFVDVGIKLYVTPTANRDGMVTMKIRPEISSAERQKLLADGKETEIPIVTTSEAETSVMIKDGVTIIIGGLRKDERTKTVKKIPGIGDLPLIGFFFRSTSDDVRKTDLIILLTPHIISGEHPIVENAQVVPREGAVARMIGGHIVKEEYPQK